jgi:hypothetical protein
MDGGLYSEWVFMNPTDVHLKMVKMVLFPTVRKKSIAREK